MIPKKIHYCWFGNLNKPDCVLKCINSWKKYCPDYEIIEWNEKNYDISKNDYMLEAYSEGKWGFVPDYARLDIIYTYGGIYLDTDVELIKPLDDLLLLKGFICFESENYIALGLGFGAEKGNALIHVLLSNYNSLHFINNDGSLNMLPSPMIQTNELIKFGLVLNNTKQIINDITIFPKDYFCPIDYETNEMKITSNTYSIHHYNSSWLSAEQLETLKTSRKLIRYFGKRLSRIIARILCSVKYRGIEGLACDIKKATIKR